MTEFLAAIGTKLADRWATALIIPGLIFLTGVTLAVRLGQGNALNAAALHTEINAIAAGPASHSTGAILLIAVGALAGSIGAALAATVVGKLVQRAWLLPGTWKYLPAWALRQWRVRRWRKADERVQAAKAAGVADDLAAAVVRRDAICLVEASRPTWIGDRFRALDLRIYRAYGLDLSAAWPGLWTISPPDSRNDLTAAQEAYASAARLVAWGLLYLLISPWWWPSAIIGGVTILVGWSSARSATEIFARLAEVTVDLYAGDLARRLGLSYDGPLTEAFVRGEVTPILQKQATSRSHPRPR
jgi:hypothetical protein